MRDKCARTVCDNEAEWIHPDAFARHYCGDCKILIEQHNPTLVGRFKMIGERVIGRSFPKDIAFNALPHQVPPAGEWKTWLVIGNRGTGKTAGMINYVIQHELPAVFVTPMDWHYLPEPGHALDRRCVIAPARLGTAMMGVKMPLVAIDQLDDVKPRDMPYVMNAIDEAQVVVANAHHVTPIVSWLIAQPGTITVRISDQPNPFLNSQCSTN